MSNEPGWPSLLGAVIDIHVHSSAEFTQVGTRNTHMVYSICYGNQVGLVLHI